MSRHHGIEHAHWDEAMRKAGFVWDTGLRGYKAYPNSSALQIFGGFDATDHRSRAEDINKWIARASLLNGSGVVPWNDEMLPRFDDPVTAAQYLLIEAANGSI